MPVEQWMAARLLQLAMLTLAVGEHVRTEPGMMPEPPAEVIITAGD
jgi:hypothetical protein